MTANPFDRFRYPTGNFEPRTPQAALMAVLDGMLPVEDFIVKAVAIRSLSEGNYGPDEYDRIIARTDLDIETRFTLKYALARLLRSPDPEEALFAAESIGVLEARTEKLIESLKRQLSEMAAPSQSERADLSTGSRSRQSLKRRLARGLYDTAILAEGSIRTFYLAEALERYREILRDGALQSEDVVPLYRVLKDLGMASAAEGLIRKQLKIQHHNYDYILCLLESLFARRDFPAIIRTLEPLRDEFNLPPSISHQVRTWLGEWEEM